MAGKIIQQKLDFCVKPEPALAVEVGEILDQIIEREIKMVELVGKSQEASRAVDDISKEIDELLSKYYQLAFALKLE